MANVFIYRKKTSKICSKIQQNNAGLLPFKNKFFIFLGSLCTCIFFSPIVNATTYTPGFSLPSDIAQLRTQGVSFGMTNASGTGDMAQPSMMRSMQTNTVNNTSDELLTVSMSKVEMTSIQVMHVLSEICPNILNASLRPSFERAFDEQLKQLLPSIQNPHNAIAFLSTQSHYRQEFSSLKGWMNSLSQEEKQNLCVDIVNSTTSSN